MDEGISIGDRVVVLLLHHTREIHSQVDRGDLSREWDIDDRGELAYLIESDELYNLLHIFALFLMI